MNMTSRSTRSSQKVLKLAHAVAKSQHSSVSVSFKELFAESYKYTIRPKYQRMATWNLRQKQQFINSLFIGDPFPPVEGYEGFFTEGEHIGENKWEIGDGQNRLLTILEFMADGFKTMSVRQKLVYEPNSQIEPVQPGKYFSQLDQLTKNYWNQYRARIDILHDRPESEKATRFLVVQNHVPVTAAEKLKVYMSKAKEAVARIEQHPFWEDFYEGKHGRGQVFQSSLYLLALEMVPGGIVDLQSGGFAQGLISGNHDEKVTDTLIDSIFTRLDIVAHVYNGLHFTRRIATVAMYQSVLFLERSGYEVIPADKGRLTAWMDTVLIEAQRASGIPNYARPIQSLSSAQGQRIFWERHRSRVMVAFNLSPAQIAQFGPLPTSLSLQREKETVNV